MEATSISSSQLADGPLPDPVAESRRLVLAASEKSVIARVLGGAAVLLQAPPEGALLPRAVKDIDLATRRGTRSSMTVVLVEAGYVPDEMFNVLHGARRLLFYDDANGRKLDVFVGEFSMCHQVPIAARLERETLTIPLAELLLTKLQIVQLTDRDERDIYNLVYHHPLSNGDGSGIEADYVARLCAQDWGLWRTVRATVERCSADVGKYGLYPSAEKTVVERLTQLWQRIEAEPKSGKWRVRNRLSDRVRWYAEPEEDPGQG